MKLAQKMAQFLSLELDMSVNYVYKEVKEHSLTYPLVLKKLEAKLVKLMTSIMANIQKVQQMCLNTFLKILNEFKKRKPRN